MVNAASVRPRTCHRCGSVLTGTPSWGQCGADCHPPRPEFEHDPSVLSSMSRCVNGTNSRMSRASFAKPLDALLNPLAFIPTSMSPWRHRDPETILGFMVNPQLSCTAGGQPWGAGVRSELFAMVTMPEMWTATDRAVLTGSTSIPLQRVSIYIRNHHVRMDCQLGLKCGAVKFTGSK